MLTKAFFVNVICNMKLLVAKPDLLMVRHCSPLHSSWRMLPKGLFSHLMESHAEKSTSCTYSLTCLVIRTLSTNRVSSSSINERMFNIVWHLIAITFDVIWRLLMASSKVSLLTANQLLCLNTSRQQGDDLGINRLHCYWHDKQLIARDIFLVFFLYSGVIWHIFCGGGVLSGTHAKVEGNSNFYGWGDSAIMMELPSQLTNK